MSSNIEKGEFYQVHTSTTAMSSSDILQTRRDPKLWPTYLKLLTLFNICFFVALGNMHAAGITTGFEELAEDFHVGFSKLAEQVYYCVLAQACANLIWMPTALCLGKRPVILFTMIMLLIGCIWGARAPTFGSLLGSRVFAALGSGSVESVGPSMIADMFFERNYSFALACFSLALTSGSQLGPLTAGYLIGDRGWRWLFILLSILVAVNSVFSLLFLPETSFHRVYYEGETAAEVDKEIPEHVENMDKVNSRDEVVSAGVDRAYGEGYWRNLLPVKIPGVDYHGPSYWLYQFVLPLKFLCVPAALFASMAYGVALGWLVIISALSPEILSPPPYNFTSSSLGLFGVSAFIGIIIAFPTAGPLTDTLSAYLGKRAARKAGTEVAHAHKPEYRLPALIVPFLVCAPGLLLFAYTYIPVSEFAASHNPTSGITIPNNPWIKPAVGVAMVGSGLALVPSVVLSYIIDAFPQTSGEGLVLINASKNIVAFLLTKFAATWLASAGLKNMFLTMSGIEWGVLALALPVYLTGPYFRRITARWV